MFGELVWLPTTRCHTSCSVVPFEREMAGNKEGVAKSGSCHGPFSFPVGKSLAMLGPIWTPHWCVDSGHHSNHIVQPSFLGVLCGTLSQQYVYVACGKHIMCDTHNNVAHKVSKPFVCCVLASTKDKTEHIWQTQKIEQNTFGKHKR